MNKMESFTWADGDTHIVTAYIWWPIWDRHISNIYIKWYTKVYIRWETLHKIKLFREENSLKVESILQNKLID